MSSSMLAFLSTQCARSLPRLLLVSLSSLPTCPRRTMSTFTLDKNIFNPTLYKNLTDVWFRGVNTDGQELEMAAMQRWFMASPEERVRFDGECRDSFAHAVEAIGPEAFPEPNAQPFLDELQRIATEDTSGKNEQAVWTALSLVLLLDQIPRNIYRTDDGLRKVYRHYDRMAYELASTLVSSHSPIPRPDKHPLFRNSAVHRLWLYMPLMHSEDLAAHRKLDEILDEYAKEIESLDGYKGSKTFLEGQAQAEKMHREILERHGRYPHRNAALGRESSAEEQKFLDEGGETFGVGQNKAAA